MSETFHKVSMFAGIDNTSDPSKLQIKGVSLFFKELLNLDIDDEGMVHRRNGYQETPIVSGSGIHSFWTNGEYAFFAQDTILKRLNKDLTITNLIWDISPYDKISFVQVNDRIFFGSNSIVGYIYEGLPYPFPDPNQSFKIKMVGGHILEFYNNRLYAANDKNLFFSDATVLTRMDNRKNAIPFNDRLTMVKAVADGLYVSADNKTFFLKGPDPFEFVSIQVLDEAAIQGSAITVDGDDIGRGISGKTIYFLTPFGPYKGYPGGIVVKRQGGRFKLPDKDVEISTSILRTDNGYKQYLAIYKLKAGQGGASGSIRLPTPSVSG